MNQLKVFAEFSFNNEINEELLFYEALKERYIRETYVISTVNDFFNKNCTLRENSIHITIDRRAYMAWILRKKDALNK